MARNSSVSRRLLEWQENAFGSQSCDRNRSRLSPIALITEPTRFSESAQDPQADARCCQPRIRRSAEGLGITHLRSQTFRRGHRLTLQGYGTFRSWPPYLEEW